MAKFDIDQHIKTRFALFEGKRAEEEDQKIYDKVYNLCLNEMILFIGQNVSKEERSALLQKLNSEDPKEAFLSSLENVPLAKQRLEARLKYFVDQLLLDSLKKHKKQ
jgi:hypothetical protein